MIDHLVALLTDAGQATDVLTAPDGMRLVVLPYGGRVLGLYTPGSDVNAFWTAPALDSPDTARACYAADGWPNSGGARTWLAPEIEFFFPDYPNPTPYIVPPTVDPGAYTVSRDGGRLRLITQGRLHGHRTGEAVAFALSKSLGFTTNPLPAIAGVRYAGYYLHTTLTLDAAPMPVGLWQLLQLPHQGAMLIPTRQATTPMPYFGALPAGCLTCSERMIRYRMDADGVYKIGVKAAVSTGRVGYRYRLEDEAALVVCDFTLDPAGTYVDSPWHMTDDLGYAVQACNVSDGALGRFSELEYHVPAIGGATGRECCDDISRVWAYRGPDALVDQIATQLLDISGDASD